MAENIVTVFLTDAGEKDLHYIGAGLMKGGVIECYSVETGAPYYLEARVKDAERPNEKDLVLLIPHHYVALVAFGDPGRQIGFHRQGAD